jgi:hypothetical protein
VRPPHLLLFSSKVGDEEGEDGHELSRYSYVSSFPVWYELHKLFFGRRMKQTDSPAIETTTLV